MTNLQEVVSRLGHRNWIAVVDSAFPELIAPGITTLVGESLPEVLDAIRSASHVRPVAFVDSELDHLDDQQVAGISSFKVQLEEALRGIPVQRVPHEKIIEMLGSAAHQFRVVIVKTSLTMPYTSVFVRLECGYWDDASEARLRDRMLGLRDPGETLECP